MNDCYSELRSLTSALTSTELLLILVLKTRGKWFTNTEICEFLLDLNPEGIAHFRIRPIRGSLYSEPIERIFNFLVQGQLLEYSMSPGPERYRVNAHSVGSIEKELAERGDFAKKRSLYDQLSAAFAEWLAKNANNLKPG